MTSALAKNAKTHFEGLNKDTCGDLALHEVLFNVDSVLKWNWAESPFDAKGPAAIIKVHEDWWSTFPDLAVVLKDTIQEGDDKVALFFDCSFTSLITGEKISTPIVNYMTGKDGKVVESIWFYDATFIMIHGKKSKLGKDA